MFIIIVICILIGPLTDWLTPRVVYKVHRSDHLPAITTKPSINIKYLVQFHFQQTRRLWIAEKPLSHSHSLGPCRRPGQHWAAPRPCSSLTLRHTRQRRQPPVHEYKRPVVAQSRHQFTSRVQWVSTNSPIKISAWRSSKYEHRDYNQDYQLAFQLGIT